MDYKKKIITTLLLTLVASVGLLLLNPERSSSESAKQYFWTNKTFNDHKYDIVAYGDSRVYRGFSTKHFLGNKNLTCFNFGYSSASFSERMLEFCASKLSDKKERKLIFGITSHSFTDHAQKDEQFVLEQSRSSFDILLRKYKAGSIKRFDPISPEDVFGFSKKVETFYSDGWVSTSEVEIDTAGGLESYKKVFEDNPVNATAVNHFMKFVEHQVSLGVDVYAYRPPTMVSMDSLEDELSGFDFKSFKIQFENAGGIWIDVPRSGYQTYDGSHLTLTSTIQFSEWLGKQILD